MSDNAIFRLDDTRTAMIDRMLTVMRWIDGRRMIDVAMPFQLNILKEFLATVRLEDMALWYKRGLIHIAKKNAKTLMLISSAMILLHTDKPMGRKGCQVVYVANDEGQADENLDFTKKLYRANPIMLDAVRIKSNVIELKDGSGYIEIVASKNADGLHGRSYRLLCFDELHAQTDYRVLEALELDPTRLDAQQLFASYSPLTPRPGIPITDMLAQHRDGVDPRFFVFSRSGSIEDANPALGGPLGSTKEEIENARVRLPTWHWRRLFLNLPGQDASAAFDGNAIERCVVKGRHSLPPQPGITYQGFTDMSGGGSDDSTLAIGHLTAEGRIVVDVLLDQGARGNGTFDPNRAVAKFADTLKLYRCSVVCGDRFGGQWPRKAFEAHGIHYDVAEKNRSALYSNLEPLLNGGLVELLDHPNLIAQLIGLVRKGEKIDSPPGEHEDHANAVAGVAAMLKSARPEPRVRFLSWGPENDLLSHQPSGSLSYGAFLRGGR